MGLVQSSLPSMGGMGDFKPLAVLKRTTRSSGLTWPDSKLDL
jgi:hypothetical protein